jgi:hypothetical protein
MKELRQMQLGDQVRQALEGARLGLDAATLSELVRELQTDIEEHIERLEKISGAMTAPERLDPPAMDATRRQEVAFQSGCDLEEVDSICDAISRGREILAENADARGGIDLRLLFSKLPGITGIDIGKGPDGVPKVPSQVIEELLGARPKRPDQDRPTAPIRKDGALEELFDLEKTVTPKNRLPKDWKP